jgi:hypothetical protein
MADKAVELGKTPKQINKQTSNPKSVSSSNTSNSPGNNYNQLHG